MKKLDPLVHEAHDGRGPRHVLLDGEVVRGVFYANIRKGKVRIYRDPFKVHKHGKRCLTMTLYGKVEVCPVGPDAEAARTTVNGSLETG